MWIAAHDATIANGTLEVIPGVFGHQFDHTPDLLSDHHKRMWPTLELEKTAVPLELRAGGVAFFCYGTPHCTRGNNTDRERAGIAFHFLHESVAAGSAYGPKLTAEDRAYHPWLTGPRATGGLREYGVRVAGTWRHEIKRTLREAAAASGPKAPETVPA
jgi:ectoine hydroxylase-related dioxygenase (phytanoyl-CoA dioxygenase family)